MPPMGDRVKTFSEKKYVGRDLKLGGGGGAKTFFLVGDELFYYKI